MNISAVIIDDELKLQEVLKIKVERYCPMINIIGTADTIQSGYELISSSKPDLVFLDISIKDETGFDLLDMFPSIAFEIIFVTGFAEYGIKALKLSAADYLLKPIITDDLIKGVHKAIEKIKNRKIIENYDILKQNLNSRGNQDNRIAIYNNDAYEFVRVGDIVRCEAWESYSKIYLMNSSCLISSQYLGLFKEKLQEFDFFSPHKSHVVNTKLIARYLKEGFIIMADESKVPVSRRKRDEFQNLFLKK